MLIICFMNINLFKMLPILLSKDNNYPKYEIVQKQMLYKILEKKIKSAQEEKYR